MTEAHSVLRPACAGDAAHAHHNLDRAPAL